MGNQLAGSKKGKGTIKSNEILGSTQKQGAKELKQNYIIDSTTQVLGSGAFGKVFKTTNKHNTDHLVAIKVLNKQKLADQVDAI